MSLTFTFIRTSWPFDSMNKDISQRYCTSPHWIHPSRACLSRNRHLRSATRSMSTKPLTGRRNVEIVYRRHSPIYIYIRDTPVYVAGMNAMTTIRFRNIAYSVSLTESASFYTVALSALPFLYDVLCRFEDKSVRVEMDDFSAAIERCATNYLGYNRVCVL